MEPQTRRRLHKIELQRQHLRKIEPQRQCFGKIELQRIRLCKIKTQKQCHHKIKLQRRHLRKIKHKNNATARSNHKDNVSTRLNHHLLTRRCAFTFWDDDDGLFACSKIMGLSNLSLSLSHEYNHPGSLRLMDGKEGGKQHFLLERVLRMHTTLPRKKCCLCWSILFVVRSLIIVLCSQLVASLRAQVRAQVIETHIVHTCAHVQTKTLR
jgi:hypothetical protein